MTSASQSTDELSSVPLALVQQIQQAERRRIARELHDRTAHDLGVAVQSLQLHRLVAATEPPRAARRLDLAESAVRNALQSVLAIGTELRRSTADMGLRAALDDYVASAAPEDVRMEVTASGPLGQIPDPVADQVFLVLREAVRNAVLHARPSRVSIDLTVAEGTLHARVSDDGSGFDAEATAHHEGGLVSMAERAELIGAHLQMDTSPAGTVVEVRLPLSDGPHR